MDTTVQDWQAEVLSLQAQGMSSTEIATAVGKHPSSVRKVIARSTEPEPSNGTGRVDSETAARLRDAAGLGDDDVTDDESIPDWLAGDESEAQGSLLSDAWETIVGGEKPTESKIRIVGGAIHPTNAPDGGVKKGGRYRVEVDVVATGYGSDDTLDAESGEVASTSETRKLKITGARFL